MRRKSSRVPRPKAARSASPRWVTTAVSAIRPTFVIDIESAAGTPTRRISRTGARVKRGSRNAGRTSARPPSTQNARGTVAIIWQVSMASAAPTRPQWKVNMKSGVQAIWSTSDVVDQMAGTRTFPSPRMTLSSMPPTKVMTAPPKRTRAKRDALACTAPLAPMSRKSGGAATCMPSPKARPMTPLSTSACPASAAAALCRSAPSARAIAEDAPAPIPPTIVVMARIETGKTSDTAPIASTPSRLTK